MKPIKRRDFLRTSGVAALAASSASAAGRVPIQRKIRVGFYGTQHGHLHGKLKFAVESPDYEIAGIYEPVAEAAERLKADPRYQPLLKGLSWVSEDKLLSDPSIDLIIVECRVWEAIPWGRKVIDAGKHLHLEKPPGNKMEPFRELVEDARRKNLLLQMGYIWRFHEGINAAIDAARQGWLGDVYMVRGTINQNMSPQARLQAARYKGGMMFELGVHQIDRAVDLLGRPKAVQSWLRHDMSYNDNLADNTIAVLEYDKALAVITCSSEMPNHTMHRSFEVIGTDGNIIVQPVQPGTKMIANMRQDRGPYKKGWHVIEMAEQHRYVGDLKDMARALKNATPLKYSYDYELMLQETILRTSGEMT